MDKLLNPLMEDIASKILIEAIRKTHGSYEQVEFGSAWNDVKDLGSLLDKPYQDETPLMVSAELKRSFILQVPVNIK